MPSIFSGARITRVLGNSVCPGIALELAPGPLAQLRGAAFAAKDQALSEGRDYGNVVVERVVLNLDKESGRILGHGNILASATDRSRNESSTFVVDGHASWLSLRESPWSAAGVRKRPSVR